MFRIAEVTRLHHEMIVRWHQQGIDNPYQGFLASVCIQLSFNYQLWHEEDIARSREVSDARIAEVKRAIDKYNQQRNDWIEKLDDYISSEVERLGIRPGVHATLNTETPGSSIDRLSILALRIYHLKEQRDRADATAEHRETVERKLAIALVQHDDLSASAQQLVDDIFAGRKRHKTYRQMKMYNDPAMNPYLYQARRAA